MGCYVAGHPLSKGNCYFEVRHIDGGLWRHGSTSAFALFYVFCSRPTFDFIVPDKISRSLQSVLQRRSIIIRKQTDSWPFVQSIILRCCGGKFLNMIGSPHTSFPGCAQDCFSIRPAILSLGFLLLTIFSTSY